MNARSGFVNLEMESPSGTLSKRWDYKTVALLLAVPTALAGVYATILLLV